VPTLPWTIPNPATPNTQAFVMVSRFEVRSAKDVPRFFLKSLSAWRQVRSAPGALGASLIAQPLKRTFFTLSAWEGRDALYAFARTEPHRSIMNGLRSTPRRPAEGHHGPADHAPPGRRRGHGQRTPRGGVPQGGAARRFGERHR
jgi:heme-degrading monooxygenase HmoA